MSHVIFSYKFNKTRCSYPPKTNAEKDGKCHWKVGNKVIDSSLYPKDYAKTWAKRPFFNYIYYKKFFIKYINYKILSS